jgi:hypothetical protein
MPAHSQRRDGAGNQRVYWGATPSCPLATAASGGKLLVCVNPTWGRPQFMNKRISRRMQVQAPRRLRSQTQARSPSLSTVPAGTIRAYSITGILAARTRALLSPRLENAVLSLPCPPTMNVVLFAFQC